MNQRLVIIVDKEKADANGVNQQYSFTFPYGAQANDIFSVLNEIGQDIDQHVKDVIAQQEAQKAKESDEAGVVASEPVEAELVG